MLCLLVLSVPLLVVFCSVLPVLFARLFCSVLFCSVLYRPVPPACLSLSLSLSLLLSLNARICVCLSIFTHTVRAHAPVHCLQVLASAMLCLGWPDAVVLLMPILSPLLRHTGVFQGATSRLWAAVSAACAAVASDDVACDAPAGPAAAAGPAGGVAEAYCAPMSAYVCSGAACEPRGRGDALAAVASALECALLPPLSRCSFEDAVLAAFPAARPGGNTATSPPPLPSLPASTVAGVGAAVGDVSPTGVWLTAARSRYLRTADARFTDAETLDRHELSLLGPFITSAMRCVRGVVCVARALVHCEHCVVVSLVLVDAQQPARVCHRASAAARTPAACCHEQRRGVAGANELAVSTPPRAAAVLGRRHRGAAGAHHQRAGPALRVAVPDAAGTVVGAAGPHHQRRQGRQCVGATAVVGHAQLRGRRGAVGPIVGPATRAPVHARQRLHGDCDAADTGREMGPA